MVVCATVGDNKQLLHVGEGARGCPQANAYANGYKSKTVNPPLDKRNRKDMQRKKKTKPTHKIHRKKTTVERHRPQRETEQLQRDKKFLKVGWSQEKKEKMYKTPKKKPNKRMTMTSTADTNH